jgi:hypothetical protein
MDCWSRSYGPGSACRPDLPQEADTKSAGSEQPQVVQAAACGGLVGHAGVLGQDGVVPSGFQGPPIALEDSSQLETPAQQLEEDSHGEPLLRDRCWGSTAKVQSENPAAHPVWTVGALENRAINILSGKSSVHKRP